MKVAIEKGIVWMDRFGRDIHLGVDRLTHQFAIGFDTPGGRIPVYLTACDLQALGLECIRITGRYAVFDFSEPIAQRSDGPPTLPRQANRPK